MLARPGTPFFVRGEGDALTALFPIRQSEGREGALAAAFVQVMSFSAPLPACPRHYATGGAMQVLAMP